MKRYLFLILTSISVLSFSQTIDVEVMASSGENFDNGNVNLSFTIGETMVETYEQGDLILSQGFHQATFTFTDVSSIDNKAVKVSLFPNPATDYVNIECEAHGYMYRLLDMNGKVIVEAPLSNTTTKLSLTEICESQFFIEVYSTRDRYRKTFKVVKQ